MARETVRPSASLHYVFVAQPRQLDAELLRLPDDAILSCSKLHCGRERHWSSTAADLREEVNSVIKRQAGGHYTLIEAAQAIADAHCDAESAINSVKLLDDMLEAFRAGVLAVRDPQTQAPLHPSQPVRIFRDWVTPTDVDAMLKAWGATYRFPDVASRPSPKPLQRREAAQQAVVAKLIELGFDPLAVPSGRNGFPKQAKQQVKEALGYSEGVMKKAWTALRKDGRVRDAEP